MFDTRSRELRTPRRRSGAPDDTPAPACPAAPRAAANSGAAGTYAGC